MIDAIRSVWVIYRMSLEVDKRNTLWWTFLAAVQPLGIFIFAIGLRELVDGAIAHDSRTTTIGAVALAVLAAGMVLHMVRWQVDGVTLGDKHGMIIDRRIIELKAAIPTLQTHEDAGFQRDLHLLRESRFWMTWVTEVTVGVIFALVQLVGIGLLLVSVQPLILLLPAFVVPSIWFAAIGERRLERAREESAEDTRLTRAIVRLSTTAAAGKEIRLFNMADDLLLRHQTASERSNRNQERAERENAVLATVGWAIFAIAYAIAIVLVVQRAVEGAASPGEVLMIVVLGTQASAVAARGIGMARLFGRMLKGGNRFRSLEAQVPLKRPPPMRTTVPSTLSRGITTENLGFRYPGADEFALRGLNIELPRGSVVALVGENGAGKTTLVKLLSGLYIPTEGRILVDTEDLREIDTRDWRDRVGAGFQDYCKFEFLVRESIGVGDLASIDNPVVVARSLEIAGANSLVDTLPKGFETQLGSVWPDGTDLSGGQWQRIALARAAMRPQPLLTILDEPTAALDPHAEHALFERISALAHQDKTSGTVTLLISHRFSTARAADLIVVLDKGRVVETGSHADLIRNHGLYAQLYEIQASAYR
jgi:ATP-binding cassette subfamily B protein